MDIVRHKFQTPNVGKVERASSLATGGLLLARGLRDKGWTGTAMALLGIAFLRRGVTGFSYSYQALGINTAGEHPQETHHSDYSVAHGAGVRIDEAVTINRPREQVFRFWRDFNNIAEFMQHVESVRQVGDGVHKRFHWVAKGPAGKRLEWDAEIINEKENERIAWRSLGGSEIANAGSVHFTDAGGGRGTEVHVEILYTPPGGKLGALAAKLFADDPAAEVREDLKRLKARLEAGVLPVTEGQPAGATAAGERQVNGAPHHPDQVTRASEESFPASDAPAYTH